MFQRIKKSIFPATVLLLCAILTLAASAAGFKDVPKGAYYAKAVDWAKAENITSGTDATHFSPNETCTRGQVVTFLWRAVGSPAPRTANNPFKDVKKSQFYYKAVLWAYENGVTSGSTPTSFEPEAPCTRGHVVTFLWRTAEEPAASGKTAFSDVAKSDYFYKAVTWAVKFDITGGVGGGKFAPEDPCTRSQIVTFLYRYQMNAHEHEYTETVKAATCSKKGYTLHTCTICGDSYKDNYTPVNGRHSYTTTVSHPNCQSQGYTMYNCRYCGDNYKSDFVAPTDHTYQTTVTAPTCAKGGYTLHTCSGCGDNFTSHPTEPTEHDYASTVVAPKCETSGYTLHTCNDCGNSYTSDTTEPAGHNYISTVVSPKCTTQGYTLHSCNICGNQYKDTYVSASGHSYRSTVTAATCSAQGYTTYSCNKCSYSYRGNYTAINSSNHNFVSGKCTWCGAGNSASAYSRLASWIRSNGTYSSSSNSYTYYDMYIGGTYSTFTLRLNSDGEIFASVFVDGEDTLSAADDFYAAVYLENLLFHTDASNVLNSEVQAYGYINGATFTSSSTLVASSYVGPSSLKSQFMETSTSAVKLVLTRLRLTLNSSGLGLTLADFGLSRY